MGKNYHVAIAGATGAVGIEMMRVLERRNFPVGKLTLLASARSAGKKLEFRGQPVEVKELTHGAFDGVDFALFSAGGGISKEFAPSAVKAGAVVVDNSSAFRMDPAVPLVVPEINPGAAREVLGKAPGLRVLDEPAKNGYPVPLHVAGKDDCEIGRLRLDCALENGLCFWICGDQLLKGAALNAVQIAELLAKE